MEKEISTNCTKCTAYEINKVTGICDSCKTDYNYAVKPHDLIGYWFTNEQNMEVTVLAIIGEWCMVEEFGKEKPYVLPLEFIEVIKKESESNT